MSKTYISAGLRREVLSRAGGCCEYCRVGADDRAIDFAIDHVIAEKHGGPTAADNLCLSCYWCNSYKGSDISSIDWAAGKFIVPLFNPRDDVWEEHFRLDEARLVAMSAVGRVTIFLLHLNAPERLAHRQLLIELEVYPCHPPRP